MAKDYNLDWLKKREASDGKGANKGANKGNSNRSRGRKGGKSGSKRWLTLKLIINSVIIGAMILLLSVAAHFILRSVTHHSVERLVPQFEMTNIGQANLLAYRNDLNIVINDSIYAPNLQGGTVIEQMPKSGTVVKPDRTIYVTVSARQRAMVTMPYVAGRSLRQAKNMLDAASINIKRLEYRSDIATNYVLEQFHEDKKISASSDVMVPIGANVTLHVGAAEGADSVMVPRVLGLPLSAARNLLLGAGINVGMAHYDSGESRADQYNALVMEQGLEYGSLCALGDMVSITLSSDQQKVNQSIRKIEQDRVYREQLKAERDSLERVAKELGLSADLFINNNNEENFDDEF